jgi:hypothetical protein
MSQPQMSSYPQDSPSTVTGYVDRSVDILLDVVETMTRPYSGARNSSVTSDTEPEILPPRRRTRESLSSRYRDLMQEAQRARESEASMGKDLKAAQSSVKALTQENADLRTELARRESQTATLEDRMRRRDRDAEQIRHEIESMKVERRRTVHLLESRTFELQGARTFLTKADSLAGEDVVRMVEALNAEIFQAAAHIADTFSCDMHLGVDSESDTAGSGVDKGRNGRRARVVHAFGEAATRGLEAAQHTTDPTVLQVFLQGGMVICSRFLIEHWYAYDPKTSKFLSDVYNSMQRAGSSPVLVARQINLDLLPEIQAIAGRWRALALAHIRTMHTDTETHSRVESWIVDMCLAILIVALPDSLSSSPATLEQAFRTKFKRSLDSITRLTFRLARAIGEEITSADMHVLCFSGGVVFDPRQMEDGQGTGAGTGRRGGVEEKILCSTHLGLRRLEKTTNKNGGVEWEKTILLSSKVALESLLDDGE